MFKECGSGTGISVERVAVGIDGQLGRVVFARVTQGIVKFVHKYLQIRGIG